MRTPFVFNCIWRIRLFDFYNINQVITDGGLSACELYGFARNGFFVPYLHKHFCTSSSDGS